MRIGSEDTKLLKTLAELERLGLAAQADLKQPYANHEILARFFWPVEIGDLYTFLANGVHYDANQQFAIAGLPA